jgi:hypothetical protein
MMKRDEKEEKQGPEGWMQGLASESEGSDGDSESDEEEEDEDLPPPYTP